MDRALREFRIRGVACNLQFLENVINHQAFRSGEVTTRFIDKTPELLAFTRRQDRATKLLRYLGDVCVNGHPEINGRTLPPLPLPSPVLPTVDTAGALPTGTRDMLRELGAEKFSRWMLEQKRVLLTDTTMRDAHQSLFATRMRTADMLPIAPFYARELVSNSGASCVMAADAAQSFGLTLAPCRRDPGRAGRTPARLCRDREPGRCHRGAADQQRTVRRGAAGGRAGSFGDLFLLDIPVSGMGYDVPRFARDAAAFADTAGKPIAVAVWQQPVADAFREAGVPTYANASEALSAFSQLVSHQERLRQIAAEGEPPLPARFAQPATDAAGVTLSEAASLSRLSAAGMPVVEHYVCRDVDAAVAAWQRLGAPVAVKASSPQVPHKSEHGLVALNCNDPEAVASAFTAQTRTLQKMTRRAKASWSRACRAASASA